MATVYLAEDVRHNRQVAVRRAQYAARFGAVEPVFAIRPARVVERVPRTRATPIAKSDWATCR